MPLSIVLIINNALAACFVEPRIQYQYQKENLHITFAWLLLYVRIAEIGIAAPIT